MADVTGGDLYHLWRVSDVHLPRVADVYYDANRLLAGAASGNDEGGFRSNTPAYPGATDAMFSSVGNAWAELRNELQNMYAQVGTTVLEAADGVRMATKLFIDADHHNSNLLDQYRSDRSNHNPDDPASNPPAAGSADDPGKPILAD